MYFKTAPDFKLHEGAAGSNLCAIGEVPNESIINLKLCYNACPGTVKVVVEC